MVDLVLEKSGLFAFPCKISLQGPRRALLIGSRMTSFHESHVGDHTNHVFHSLGGHDMLEDLAEYAGKGYRTVICCRCFVLIAHLYLRTYYLVFSSGN